MENSPMDYNPIASQFDDFGKVAVTDWALGFDRVTEMLSPLQGKKILDYGCGSGKYSRYLKNKGAEVFGVDVSSELIKVANGYQDGIDYGLIESGDLSSFDTDFFDAVTANFVLCTIPSREEIITILREINRILKPQGVLISLQVNWEKCNGKEFINFKLDNIEDLHSGAKVGGVLKGPQPIRIDDFFWSQEDYRDMFTKAGFQDISIVETIATDKSHEWINEDKVSPFFIVKGIKGE